MILYTVVPCYNEEKMLPVTRDVLKEKYIELIKNGTISPESRILFVDDGSDDGTWKLISGYNSESKVFCGIRLSRNRGHQNALMAGLMTAMESCDAALSIDADLQDDVSVIDEMIAKYKGGADIVYGVRSERKSDSFLKRATAEAYYGIMNAMGAGIIRDHADFRLMSRRSIEALSEFGEVNLFLRGMVPLVGFESDTVLYERKKRQKGESKYTLAKMIKLGADGITSFTTFPIDVLLAAGIVFSGLSLIAMLVLLILTLCGTAVSGFAWLSSVIFLCTGILLEGIGTVGLYVGKTYLEAKHRPRYVIEEKLL